MLNLLRNLLRDDEPPAVAAPAPVAGMRRPPPGEQRLLADLSPKQRACWDASGGLADELEAYIVAADRREWDAVALLVERLTGTPFDRCLSAPFVEPSAVPLLVSPLLLLRVSPPVSSFVLLQLFAQGVRGRTASACVCARAPMVACLVGLLSALVAGEPAVPSHVAVAQLVDAALACLHEVLVHHTATGDVTLLLEALHTATGAHVDGFTQRLLRTLSDVMACESRSPERCRAAFLCDGDVAAGLVCLVQHPPRGGLTLLLWLRIEVLPAAGGDDAIVPLVSLYAAGGPLSGVALGFHAPTHTLQLRSLASGKVVSTARTPAAHALSTQTWVSVGLVMSRATLLSDSASVYINGAFHHGCSLPFPPAMGDGAPQRLCVGCWGPATAPPPLVGLLGTCTLFGHACSSEDMAHLHAASTRGQVLTPPSSALSDRRTREQQLGGSAANQLPRKLTERGHHKLVVAIDPGATDATWTSWSLPSRSGASLQVQLLQPGTRAVVTQSLAGALASAGGPPALLPLLLRHGMPLAPPPCEDVTTSMFPQLAPPDACRLLPLPKPCCGVSPPVAWSVIHILPHVLPTAAPGDNIATVRCLATLLRCGEPQSMLTPQLAAHLLELTRCIDATKVCVTRDGAPEWEPAALLLLDFPLWRAASDVARKAHWGAVRSYLETASDSMASAFGGEFLCHFLRPGSGGDGSGGDGSDAASEERLALLRIVQAHAENGARPGVRSAVCRQLVRFIHTAATVTGESAVHTDILMSCAQLLVAIIMRELNSGGGKPAAPPLASSPDGIDVTRVTSCLQLLLSGGGVVAAALCRSLKAHPSPLVACIAQDLRAAVFNADAAAAGAADAVVSTWSQASPDMAWLSTLLAPVPAFADARMCASAAQAWCSGRSGRGHAYRLLRRLVTSVPHGPWTAIAPVTDAQLPGQRPFWRLEDGAARDGARRRMLPLERDACWSSAARVHDDPQLPPADPLSVGRDGTTPRDASGPVVLPASRSVDAPHRLDEDEEAEAVLGDTYVLPPLPAAPNDLDQSMEADVHTDDDDAGDADGDAADGAAQVDSPVLDAPLPSGVSEPSTPVTPARGAEEPQEGGLDGDGDLSPFSLVRDAGNPAALLSRLRARASAAAATAVGNVANVAAQASRRVVSEAMDKAKGASSTVALAQELVAEHLSLVQTAAVPAACTMPPLPPWVLHPRGLPRGLVAFSAPAEWVRPDAVRPGTIQVASGHIVFVGANGEGNGCALPLATLAGMQLRRRHMRRCGLEAFFTDGRSFLFNLPAPAGAAGGDTAPAARERASALHHAVMLQRPLCAVLPHARTLLPPARLVERVGWTRAWQRREISTFEYLMHLNQAAGRSVNDMSQYPVMPWVLADYTSPELDLSSPATFRDFSLPMGAQTAGRRSAVAEFYSSLQGGEAIGDIPPFHHGTHYSTPGGVLHLLMRLEPYASMHVQLQSGSFDYADRLLHSVEAAWRSATSTSHDVKELVPEWFTCPAVLCNGARLPLGRRQDGTQLGDVVLPPWAQGSPEQFIRLHRAALESDLVSANIHQWVDLVFGCKQRGPPAVEALNSFFYTSYEGAVDFTALADERQRTVYIDQLTHFGQTPMQLFREPHPARGPPPSDAPFRAPRLSTSTADPSDALLASSAAAHDGCPVVALAFLAPSQGAGGGAVASGVALCSVDDQGRLLTFKVPCMRAAGGAASRSSFAPVPALEATDGTSGHVSKDSLGPVLAAGWSAPLSSGSLPLGSSTRVAATHLVAAAPDMGGLLTGGWSDGTVLAFGRDHRSRPRPVLRIAQASPPGVSFTCLAHDAGVLVVGASDGAVLVFRGPTAGGGPGPEPDRPALVLRGHSAPVTVVAACAQADVLVAGAADGRCVLYTLGAGTLVRVLPQAPGPLLGAAISPVDGSVAVHAMCVEGRPSVAVFTQGGACLARAPVVAPLLALGFTPDGTMVMTATPAEGICMRWAHNLEPAAPLVLPAGAAAVTCATLSPDGLVIAVGGADGGVHAYKTPGVT